LGWSALGQELELGLLAAQRGEEEGQAAAAVLGQAAGEEEGLGPRIIFHFPYCMSCIYIYIHTYLDILTYI
jgi:hypothetical protein